MPKVSSFDPTYDEAYCIRARTVTGYGQLDRPIYRAEIYWTQQIHGEQRETARIRYTISRPVDDREATLHLEYVFSGDRRDYKIRMISIPSNLGKGLVWYFICPATFKKCRRLYLLGGQGYFLHREAYSGILYESQKQSKYYRFLDRVLGSRFRVDRAMNQLYEKGFTRYYNGKPTKRYQRILDQMNRPEEPISRADFEAMIYR
jgi:hypothetical protein